MNDEAGEERKGPVSGERRPDWRPWTEEETTKLKEGLKQFRTDWDKIATLVGTKTPY